MTRSDKLILHGTDVDSNCESERELQECILLGGCNRGIYAGQTSRGFGIMVTRRGEKGICYRNSCSYTARLIATSEFIRICVISGYS